MSPFGHGCSPANCSACMACAVGCSRAKMPHRDVGAYAQLAHRICPLIVLDVYASIRSSARSSSGCSSVAAAVVVCPCDARV